MNGTPSLDYARIKAMLESLPPARPDVEFHYSACSSILPGCKKIRGNNRSPFGGNLIPMMENTFVPYGIVVAVTRGCGLANGGVATKIEIFDLRPDEESAA